MILNNRHIHTYSCVCVNSIYFLIMIFRKVFKHHVFRDEEISLIVKMPSILNGKIIEIPYLSRMICISIVRNTNLTAQ